MLVYGIVDHFPDEVVEPRAIMDIADVHARAFAHRLEALENRDVLAPVVGRGRNRGGGGRVSHEQSTLSIGTDPLPTQGGKPRKNARNFVKLHGGVGRQSAGRAGVSSMRK